MNITPEFLEELRSRVPVSEIVSRRVVLHKHGREFKGLCPFHNEKTPSFTVVDDKNFYHCFGCGAHGDVITFTMETDGLSFPEAVERLAAHAGLEVPKATPEDRARVERARGLGDVVEAACRWYQDNLAGPEGAAARAYLQRRRLADRTIATFRLGFAPARRGALLAALRGQGFSVEMMVEAGLVKRAEDGEQTYDYFRDRVMFPITDRTGRVIAFGGRTLGDGQPKYLNSPDNPLFHKGRVLYGLAQARKPARDANAIVVSEGYMDVIALHQAGITHAVAPLGTALTEDQIRALWRMAAEPILCFDGDAAGARAAGRAGDRALPMLTPGHSLRFVTLPSGQDPDDLLQADGVGAMRDRLAAATSLVDFLWLRERGAMAIDTPERRADFHRRVRGRVKVIADQGVRMAYQDEIEARIRAERQVGRGGSPMDGFGRARPTATFARGSGDARVKRGVESRLSVAAQTLILKVIVHHPGLIDEFAERLGALYMGAARLDKLRQEILEIASQDLDLDSEGLQARLIARGHAEISTLLNGQDDLKAVAFAKPTAPFDKARAGLVDLLHRAGGPDLGDHDGTAEIDLANELDEDGWRRFLLVKEQEMALRSQFDD